MTPPLDRGMVVRVRLRTTRPAVVVSNRAACRFDAVIQVVPATGLPDRDLRPYESRVESPGSGLAKPSRLVANQIRTVSKQRVEAVLGRLDRAEERLLDRALRIQLALG
ncbi:MAG TPA: type II toxin-antitoxin system PemK/MazF family toxin [Thermoanaerobaculia bacterium]|nr:type II toxin-antitoxin system PemK/MazF family toxin [Thermoanaerobaculia bacterium]